MTHSQAKHKVVNARRRAEDVRIMEEEFDGIIQQLDKRGYPA